VAGPRRVRRLAAPPEPALPLRGVDHRDADAVLDRAPGVEDLRLGVDGGADALGDPVQPDERCPADRLKNVLIRLSVGWHSCPAWRTRCPGRGASCRRAGRGARGATCRAAPPWYHAAAPARSPRW